MNPRKLLVEKKTRASEIKSLSRNLTGVELREAEELVREIPELEAKCARMDDAAKSLASLAADDDTDIGFNSKGDLIDQEGNVVVPAGVDGRGGAKSGGYLRLKDDASFTARVVSGMAKAGGPAGDRKALVPDGQAVVSVQLTASPVSEGRPAAGLLDVLPVIPNTSARFEYLRQTERVLNAAPVAAGTKKPTTVLGLERVPGELRVVAHLSEGIDQYMLSDYAALTQFVNVELIHGLVQAIEEQTLTGDGTGANLEGILSTSGVLQQDSLGDPLVTTRKAITRLERAGLVPSGSCSRLRTGKRLSFRGRRDRVRSRCWTLRSIVRRGGFMVFRSR